MRKKYAGGRSYNMKKFFLENSQTTTSYKKWLYHLLIDPTPKYTDCVFLERNREQVITISYKKINNLSNIIIECFYEYCDYIIEKSYIDQLKKAFEKNYNYFNRKSHETQLKLFICSPSIIKHFHLDYLHNNLSVRFFLPIFYHVCTYFFIYNITNYIYNSWLYSLSFRHAVFRVMP